MSGKRVRANREAITAETSAVREAVDLLLATAAPKFDESLDLHLNLNIDPRQADQQIRGTLSLPHGTGSETRVAVFVEGDGIRTALDAGAAVAGGKEFIDEVKNGRLDFDVALATPDMMRSLAPLGRVLGPRALMPSPKAGTVVTDVPSAIAEFKKGKQPFRNDAGGNVHLRVGKRSFSADALVENVEAALAVVIGMRPSAAKGVYVKRATLALTMGPAVRLEV